MYDKTFYDTIRSGTQESARWVAPLVLDHVKLGTGSLRVIDVGCGEGWWAEQFARLGCEVIGIDGHYVEGSPLGDRFIPHDLTEGLPEHLADRFDLAVCLEVAEHLPEWRAESFVMDLCELAPVVLFSAAIPGQGGTGHVNEQWPSYWFELFEQSGYHGSGALRWEIWDNPNIENWYRQNLFVFAQDPTSVPDLFDTPLAAPHSLVHPVLYNARRGA